MKKKTFRNNNLVVTNLKSFICPRCVWKGDKNEKKNHERISISYWHEARYRHKKNAFVHMPFDLLVDSYH